MKLELKLSINMANDRNTPNFQSVNIGCKQSLATVKAIQEAFFLQIELKSILLIQLTTMKISFISEKNALYSD